MPQDQITNQPQYNVKLPVAVNVVFVLTWFISIKP